LYIRYPWMFRKHGPPAWNCSGRPMSSRTPPNFQPCTCLVGTNAHSPADRFRVLHRALVGCIISAQQHLQDCTKLGGSLPDCQRIVQELVDEVPALKLDGKQHVERSNRESADSPDRERCITIFYRSGSLVENELYPPGTSSFSRY
jgi:hypothetical protein